MADRGLLQTGPDDALGLLVDLCVSNPPGGAGPISRALVERAAEQLRASRADEVERAYVDEEVCETNRDRDPCGDCYGCQTAAAHRIGATDG